MTPVQAQEAILDDPEDVEAWRSYAAHLLEQNDLRGELILSANAPDPDERAAHQAFVERHRGTWTPTMLSPHDCTWRYGFPIEVTYRVSSRSVARDLRDCMADPRARLVGRLRLDFAAGVTARGLAVLGDADLGRLRTLVSRYHTRGTRIARTLARQRLLRLRALDLRHSHLDDEGLLALAGSELRGLRTLHLQHNRFGARGLEALAASPVLATLERLDLRHNRIGSAGAAALAASPHIGRLTTLLLHAGHIDSAGVRALAASTVLRHDLVRYWRAQVRA